MVSIQQIGKFQFIVEIHIRHQLENFVISMKMVKDCIENLKEFYNLRWYIQHLGDENEYQYGDNLWTNPLSESNWTY